MKRNNLIVLFMLLFALTASTCKKKNYPKDIPIWLKNLIEKEKKESKRNTSRNISKMAIDEYTDGSSTFYHIDYSYEESLRDINIYDYSGNMICLASASSSTPCNNLGYKKTFIRNIWHEN